MYIPQRHHHEFTQRRNLHSRETKLCYCIISRATPLSSQYCSRVNICFKPFSRSSAYKHRMHRNPSSCGRLKIMDESPHSALLAARNFPFRHALHSTAASSESEAPIVQIVVSDFTQTPVFFCILPPLSRTSSRAFPSNCIRQLGVL